MPKTNNDKRIEDCGGFAGSFDEDEIVVPLNIHYKFLDSQREEIVEMIEKLPLGKDDSGNMWHDHRDIVDLINKYGFADCECTVRKTGSKFRTVAKLTDDNK